MKHYVVNYAPSIEITELVATFVGFALNKAHRSKLSDLNKGQDAAMSMADHTLFQRRRLTPPNNLFGRLLLKRAQTRSLFPLNHQSTTQIEPPLHTSGSVVSLALSAISIVCLYIRSSSIFGN